MHKPERICARFTQGEGTIDEVRGLFLRQNMLRARMNIDRLHCGDEVAWVSAFTLAGGAVMGIGMHITYVGFQGAASLESEAALQLLRLQTYAGYVSDLWVSIERQSTLPTNAKYEVRLSVGKTRGGARRIGRCVCAGAEAALRCAFSIAVRALELISGHCRL